VWRVRVESKLPQEILRLLSHSAFATDAEWIEILRKVGRQEEELLEREKLTKSLTTNTDPLLSEKETIPTKGSIPNTKRRGKTTKPEKDRLDGRLLKITAQKLKIPAQRMNIPIGKWHTKKSRTMGLKNKKGRNAVPLKHGQPHLEKMLEANLGCCNLRIQK